MDNNKLSNDINEKISTVFQLYAVNPIKDDIDDNFDKFEKNFFSEDAPFAVLRDNINDIKNKKIPNIGSKIDELKDSIDLCEQSVNFSVNNAAEQFSEMAGNNQKAIISRIDAASEEAFERLRSENAFLRKIIYVLMAISGTSLAGTVALLVLNFLG